MKLRNLNAAIDAAPKVYARFSFGPVALEKGSLKAALKANYGQGTTETLLTLRADHFLTWEPADRMGL
jgi:hypothetical protein